MRRLHRILAPLLLAWPALALGQSGPDVNDLVIQWATGRFASPVFCEMDGELVQGLRRVILRPRYTPNRRARLAVHFIDMRPEDATRCVNATGHDQPNVLGKLLLQVTGTPHPETAQRDFKRRLKRPEGFELDVTEGVLKVHDVTVPASEPRVVDFRGGKASLRRVFPATDADRELKAFPSPQKAILTIWSPDEKTRLELPLFLASEDPV